MTQAEQEWNQYDKVEGQLQESFRPVIPDPEFVRRLYHRLTTTPATTVERRSNAALFLFVAFGILTGVVMIMLAVRLVNWVLKQF